MLMSYQFQKLSLLDTSYSQIQTRIFYRPSANFVAELSVCREV